MADVERPATSDLTSFIHQQMPLCALLGVEALEMDPANVRLALPWRADLCTAGGRLHGGALMALRGLGRRRLRLREPARGRDRHLDHRVEDELLRGRRRRGPSVATARPLHVGSTTIVVETEIRSDDGKLAAKVTQTQIVLRPRS